jgi:nitrite reductase (NADH) small subunit
MADLFVCHAGELKDGDLRIVEVKDFEIGIYRRGDKYYAYRNHCLHQGGPVCEGVMMPKVVELIAPDHTLKGQDFDYDEMHIVCPWHGYEYKLETGECATDAKLRLQRFKIVERDGDVFVAL